MPHGLAEATHIPESSPRTPRLRGEPGVERSEGIGHPRVEEVARRLVGLDRGAGEKDAVTDGEADIAGDLPVEVQVDLGAQVVVVAGRLVDRAVADQLVEEE